MNNAGVITGLNAAVAAANNVNVVNSGTIAGGQFGVYGFGSVNLTNSGTISGIYGVRTDASLGSSTLVNSGTIIGAGSSAIDFAASAFDTVTFLPGSRIFGEILLGTNDSVNIVTGRSASMMLSFGCSCGQYGITLTGSTLNVSGGAPYVYISGLGVAPDVFATLDPTAFALADKNLVSFTGFISSVLGNRFGEFSFAGTTPSAFAPPAVNGIVDGANAAFGNALAYGGDSRMPNAAAVDRASGIAVWSKGFVGARTQSEDGPNLSSATVAYGGVIGVDKQFTSDLRIGAFLGAGNARLNVDQNSQTVKTNYAFGGLYGRFDWTAQFFDFAVTGGTTSNNSARTVADNINGLQTASASYNGWFVSPELAYGLRVPLDNKITLTPAARLRYVAGFLDGYSETGSAQNLSVASRTTQNIEERLEVAVSRSGPAQGGLIKTTATFGVLGQERLGASAINTVLLGQNLSFAAAGQNNAAGFYIGASVDYRVTQAMTLFAAVEGTMMSDNSNTGVAQGGLRVALQ